MSLYSVYEGDFYDFPPAPAMSPEECAKIVASRLEASPDNTELLQRIAVICAGENLKIEGEFAVESNDDLGYFSTPPNNFKEPTPTTESPSSLIKQQDPRYDDSGRQFSILQNSSSTTPTDFVGDLPLPAWLPYLMAGIVGTLLVAVIVFAAIIVFRRIVSYSNSTNSTRTSLNSSTASSTSTPQRRLDTFHGFHRTNETPVVEVTFHRPENPTPHRPFDMTKKAQRADFFRPASTSQTRRKFMGTKSASGSNVATINGNSTSLWVDCADEIVRLLTVDPNSSGSGSSNNNTNQSGSVVMATMATNSTATTASPPRRSLTFNNPTGANVGTYM